MGWMGAPCPAPRVECLSSKPLGQVFEAYLGGSSSIPDPQVMSQHESPVREHLNGPRAGKKCGDIARTGKHGRLGQATQHSRDVARNRRAATNTEGLSVAQVTLRES
jgi:hypothetical protein